jgi:potassium large conductance calcium-activated channel subfamily M alpha protein 1
MVFMLTAAILIPYQVNRLAKILSQESKYSGSYKGKKQIEKSQHPNLVVDRTNHVIISGRFSAAVLSDFLAELFHTDHLIDNLHAVLLLPGEPSESILELLRDMRFEERTFYLRGSPLVDKDLKRVGTKRALAYFILSNHYSKTPIADDQASFIEAMSIKNYNPKIRILVQLIRTEMKVMFLSFLQKNMVTHFFPFSGSIEIYWG